MAVVGLAPALSASLAWAAISFDPSSGVGTMSRGDIVSYVGAAELIANPNITFEQAVTLSQLCTKVVSGLPRQALANTPFQRKRLVAVDAQAPGPTKQITSYVLKGFTADLTPLPVEICSSGPLQGEPGWMPAGPLTSAPAGRGLLTFNGKPIPY